MATTAGGSSSTMTQSRSSNQPSWTSYLTLQSLRHAAWTAVDVVTLFARTLIDPNVKSLADGQHGSNGTGVRGNVNTVHAAPTRGSASGNRLGGSGPSSSSGSGPRPLGRISGLSNGPTNCTPAGG